ncbi:hypothetical protein ED733_002585 [Metarhizium rileyi]|uniref:Uncharacterized protein n=1 Tax=Metarhizium rileyi (strain RCEF 4871) TaxID=1649241 RepID=A0A5C6G921_METRR|nr:hypothetical protein ED733_002585 [Metarhizium rileyi]
MDIGKLDSLQERLEEEIRLRKQLERQTRNTTLPEFLDACHRLMFLGLNVGPTKSSTKDDPANAELKLRPDSIREWSNFPQEQSQIWRALMQADFTERHFTPLIVMEVNGKELRKRSLRSELDLGYFERQTVETPVASVIEGLFTNTQLRETFQLKGDVSFENHANTLTDERILVTDMSSMSLEPAPLRRSRRLAAKSGGTPSLPAATRQDGHQECRQQRLARPRADQFCVYNKGISERLPAFIVEYKSPHKLSLAHIKAGLVDMDLDDIVRLQQKNETPETICRRVVAAVITQVYSYMITGGIELGYVCTGEAFIYIHVKRDEPKTAYYYLSVPREDVGESTGWTADLDDNNRLHLTALGQVLAFTLRALQTTPRANGWIKWAEANLQRWEMVYDVILDEIQEKDILDSNFKPAAQSRDVYSRLSPVKTMSRAMLVSAACGPSQHITPLGDYEKPDGEFDPNTPSRSPREPRAANPSSRRTTTKASRDESTGGTIMASIGIG